MKLGKFLVTIVFAFFLAFEGIAQNAVLNSCYVVHNDKDREGKKEGMRFHLNLSVSGLKGQKFWCIIEMAYYEGDDSYYFTRTKGNFHFNDHLAVYKQLTATYKNSTWNDLQLFLPYVEVKKSIGEKDWKKGITYCVSVIDTDGNVLLQEWQTSKRMGYTQKIYPWETCGLCHGTGICNMCKGSGGQYFYTQGFVKDNYCSGTGKCRICQGSGRMRFSDLMCSYDIPVNNGTYSGSTMPYDYNNLPSSSGGNNTKTESSSKTTCPICHGTGRCTSCAGRGWKEGQYVSGVYDCSVCNGGGQCSMCYGRGFIR